MNLSFLARRGIFQPIMVAMKEQSQVSPWRVRLAWLLLGLTVLLAFVELPLWPTVLDWYIAHFNLPYSPSMSMFLEGLNSVSSLVLALLGTLIIFAQPENRIGWLLSSSVFIVTLSGLCEKYAVYAYVIAPERELPLRELALWIQHWVGLIALPLLFVALPLLFPNGRLPSKRWRWFARGAIGVTGLMFFIMAFHPDVQIEGMFLLIENDLSNPYGIAALPIGLLLLLDLTWILTLLVILPIACLSLVVRYRQTDDTTRQQIKWFSLWLGIVIVLFVVRHFNGLAPNTIDEIALRMALFSLPIFLGISLFKYHLYDIDIIVNRTLVYATLSILIAGMYVLVVGIISNIFQARDNIFPPIIATGLAALSFQHLREIVQRWVNRLLFGQRDDPYAVLTKMGERLESAIMPQDILLQTATTMMTTLKLPYVRILIQRGEDVIAQVEQGNPTSSTVEFPLIYNREIVGDLVVGQRSSHEALSRGDKKVLQGIARQLSAVVYTIRLQTELKAARQRLVTQLEAERRRIRRDLHDGLGPALASQTLKLDAAAYFFSNEPQKSLELIDEVREQSDTLVQEVRRLVHNLRPPALDEMGLIGAIRTAIARFQVGNHHTRIDFAADKALPPLSAAIEAAAYRIVLEAITNTLKHAHAARCSVRLHALDNMLHITVKDDGCGIPDNAVLGIGLQSMRERTEELSGQLTIDPNTQNGTTINVQFPLRGDL